MIRLMGGNEYENMADGDEKHFSPNNLPQHLHCAVPGCILAGVPLNANNNRFVVQQPADFGAENRGRSLTALLRMQVAGVA